MLMFWDGRSVQSTTKIKDLVTGLETTINDTLLSESSGSIVVGSGDWKTTLNEGTSGIPGPYPFLLFYKGTFNNLGTAPNGKFAVGDSAWDGAGASIRPGSSSIVLVDDGASDRNFIPSTGNLSAIPDATTTAVVTEFIGAAGLLVDVDANASFKSYRGTVNATPVTEDHRETTATGDIGATDWPEFSKLSWADTPIPPRSDTNAWYGFSLPTNATVDMAGVILFRNGLPSDAEINTALDYIADTGYLPKEWVDA